MVTIEQRVKRIVAQQLGLKEDLVLNESSFCEDLDSDSLDAVELTLALEEEFELKIANAERLTTVQSAIDYISAHTKD